MLIVSLEQLAFSLPWASELGTGDLQFIDDFLRDEVASYLFWIDYGPTEGTSDDMLWIFVVFAVLLQTRLAKRMPMYYIFITRSAIFLVLGRYRSKLGTSTSPIS